MAQARRGDVVRVHYTGRLDDGQVFDRSDEEEPLEFKIGEGEIIEAFETAIVGMSPGDSKTVTIEAADAYGLHRDDRILTVGRDELPDDVELSVGQQLQLRGDEDPPIIVTVIDVTPSTVTLDGNHPLAGENLTFDLRLVDIRPTIIIAE